jgi:hypothetical protein
MDNPEKPDVVLIPVEPPHGASDPRTGRSSAANAGARRFSKKRLFLAFAIAGVSDIVGAAVTWIPPAVWALDMLTALLLFIVLGWSWWLLPGLVMEAIPGLEVLPFWVLVVGAIALLGSPRSRLK